MMTYKEALLFIGKCLTISYEEKNKLIIEDELKLSTIDWEAIVKLSTKHYVFPALYCNLKRANFLHYLPEELVNYMIHITDLNRERNQQIIAQAKELNELLLANSITPIFLKGVGNLFQDLYEDIAERMLSDIDLLVSENDISKAIHILKENNYYILKQDIPESHGRHYPKLVHTTKISGVEVHRKMLRAPYSKHFNYNVVKNNVIKHHQKEHTLGYTDQIVLNVLSKQVNDYGHFFKNVALRSHYDTFLLSKKTNFDECLNTKKSFFKILNGYFAVSTYVLNSPTGIYYIDNLKTRQFLKKTIKIIENPTATKRSKLKAKIFHKFLPFKRGISVFLKATYKKEYLFFIWSKISNMNWYKERFFKVKPNL
ncbi:MAG: nucleotidyltransferase domain-containing protein [Polaribacter sp.]